MGNDAVRYDDYHRDLAALCHQMRGAGQYLADHHAAGTDERLAEVFRDYLARIEERCAEFDEASA